MELNCYLTNRGNLDTICRDTEFIEMLISHMQYSVKDIEDYNELTDEEKKIIKPHQFAYLKAQFTEPILVQVDCSHCKRIFELVVDKKDLIDYHNNGELIQTAFPYLSASDRELIMNHLCDDCFHEIMGPEE